ncbi:MAG: hypothetical protein QOG54_2836 [Actinomycetota bacterium]|jgi:hypothetical protein|nr:hypothetical protein [Actinomycetota bacterium]
MSSPRPPDIFDKARSVAASVLFACGLAAILGAVLAWVTVELPELGVPNGRPAETVTGIEGTDGWIVIVAGAMVIVAAVLLVLRATSGYAWLAFLASMVVGGIALANYRQLDQIGEPAMGLLLVAAAGIIGVIAAAAGVAASPRRAN